MSFSDFQNIINPTNGNGIASNAFYLAIGLFALFALLLSLGRRLEPALRLERLGVPIALITGFLALMFGPYGAFTIFPQSVTDIWQQLPTPLLTLVFATLMLGRPIPKGKKLWRPVASQALLGLLLGFGQYLVGGLAVIFILIPFLDVDPLMGCLIEIGFEGGHGAAAIMGDSFFRLGFPEGLDLGLAMATIGLLSSTLIGSGLVVFGRWIGWLVPQVDVEDGRTGANENPLGLLHRFQNLLVNLSFVGLAVLIGVLLLYFVRQIAPMSGNLFQQVLISFPVFPLALLGSFLIRYTLELTGKTYLVSQILQREIGTLATDLLITFAMASINLPLLLNDWVPLTILAATGLTWNLGAMFVFAKIAFKEEWFERSIAEFGNATGVAASGILLLRLSDPRNLTNTLPIFSMKQLFLQPLLSGGIITVFAPIAVNQFGLKGWTSICGFLSALFIVGALILQNDNDIIKSSN